MCEIGHTNHRKARIYPPNIGKSRGSDVFSGIFHFFGENTEAGVDSCSKYATIQNNNITNERRLKISPKEQATQFSARLNSRAKKIIQEEAQKTGMSMTEYLERLIEGTLPDKIESKMEEILREIKELKEKMEK